MSTFAELKSFADRIDRLNEEIKTLNADKSEVFALAKGRGFDVKVLKAAIQRRAKLSDNPMAVEEHDALLDLYLKVILGQATGETPQAAFQPSAKALVEEQAPTRARAHEETSPAKSSPQGPAAESVSSNASALSVPQDDMGEIPKFLRRKPTAAQLMGAG